ncbi:MAG: cupin domain-containing protein [Alistipes sp.]|nr:cupin domain-containing protein [Alistipes sp.]
MNDTAMNDFTTPPGHVAFLAKRLFGAQGELLDGSIARLEAGGGGPVEPHTHPHDHLFIVVSGQARVVADGKEIVVHEGESYRVNGSTLHSVWNDSTKPTVMIGLSVGTKNTK